MQADNQDHLNELSDPLRKAVDQVRSHTPPADAVQKAVDRAGQRPVKPKPRFRRHVLAAVAIAAAVLVGISLWTANILHFGASSPEQRQAKTEIGATADTMRDPQVATEQRAGERDKDDRKYVADLVVPVPNFDDKSKADAKPGTPGLPPLLPQGGAATSGSTTSTGSGSLTWTGDRPSSYGGGTVILGGIRNPDSAAPVPPPLRVPDVGHLPAGGEGRAAPGMAPPSATVARPVAPAPSPAMPPVSDPPVAFPSPATVRAAVPKEEEEEAEHALKRYETLLELRAKTPGAMATEELRDAYERLTPAQKESLGKGDKKPPVATTAVKEPAKKPSVWHRDRQQPTFARVYIGDHNSLELVSIQVTTTIEGPRARTVVDHIFRNPHPQQLEGTFEYPLPTGASPSYFAMFLGQTRDTVPARFGRRDGPPPPVDALAKLTPAQLVKHVDTADWGQLREARVVNNEKALETYEDVVRGRVDPALLEYAGGNTFRGRVFPIPAKGYNRVIIAYEETLPVATGEMVYRFPLPGVQLQEMNFSLQANAAECQKPVIAPKQIKQDTLGSALLFSHTWTKTKPQGEIVFRATPANPAVQAVSGQQGENGPRYVYARLRPELKTVAKKQPFAQHAVFLLDTSLSEQPDRFGVSMMLLKRILEDDADIKNFNVLTFNVGAAWVERQGWLPNTKEGRDQAIAKLDGIVLEGATDFSCALDKLVNPGFDVAAGTPVNCFVLSDGNITWGESDVASVVAKFDGHSAMTCRFHCFRTGLGAENLELYEALTRNGGGIYNCYGEADLKAAAAAHRNQCLHIDSVRLVGGPSTSDVLVAGRRAAVYPGGELILTARANGSGKTTAVIEGTFCGQKYAEEFPIEVGSGSELAPRAWAEVAVGSLLALNDPKLDTLVTAYCQQFGIVGRTASFLVLENDNDYKRFNLEAERGKTLTGDLGEFLNDAWAKMSKAVSARESFVRFLDRIENRVNVRNNAGVKRMLALLKDKDFELAAAPIDGGPTLAKTVPPEYLAGMQRDRREVDTYLREARRRAEKGDKSGAVRALSSVIEEHPGRGDALRLVGYRLLDLGQSSQAVRLFERVQRQRPFEPHSYRDLAHSLEQAGLYPLAAVNYEIVLAGTWHARFQNDLRVVVLEEYVRMMQEAIRKKAVSKEVADVFGERLEALGSQQKPADLRVTISWNTDATDVDLWVIEPDGTKCFYQHKQTKNGGELSNDQTQGYGPERYQVVNAMPGTYTVIVHYYSPNRNLLGGETHVKVSVTRNAGRPNETTEGHTVILKRQNEQVEVCKVKF